MLAALYQKSRPYRFLMILLLATILGAVTGYWMGSSAVKLKPLGDIFLNLIFTVVIPLVFFSVSSAIAEISELRRLGKIIFTTIGVFIFMNVIAAAFMLICVKLFPLGQGITIPLPTPEKVENINFATQLANIFTVSDFIKLFSRENMLALIFFSLLVGLATSVVEEKGKSFATFLLSGKEIVMKITAFVMYYAPIGFFAYFAVLVGELGPKLLTTYFQATVVYYSSALFYFVVVFTIFAFLAAKTEGIKAFWQNVALPTLTALATCSSAASIAANLQATRKIGVPAEVNDLVVPLGGITHKDGSVLGGIVKIAFLFGIFHMDFSGTSILLMALMIGVLVGTVMGAIPSGGMVGEMLIVSFYGFPPEALIIIAAISMIIDPPATMLNVTSNTVASMLVARWVEGKDWLLNRNK